MASDLFAAVHAAEAKADQTVKEAQQAARELVKKTETQCGEKERQAARENRALFQSLMEKQREATQASLDGQAADELQKIEEQMAKARERLPQAVEFIAERVMNDGDR